MWKFLQRLFGKSDFSEFAPDPNDVQAPPPPPAGNDLDDGDEPEEEGFEPEAKAPVVVAERFVRLVLLTKLADAYFVETTGHAQGRPDLVKAGRAASTRVMDHLVALGISADTFEPVEEVFLRGVAAGQVEKPSLLGAQWRLECAAMLAWALGQPAPDPNQSTELEGLDALIPKDKAAYEAFCSSAKQRALPVLMSKRGEVLNRFFPLMMSPGEAASRALERARAMRWLTEPTEAALSSIKM